MTQRITTELDTKLEIKGDSKITLTSGRLFEIVTYRNQIIALKDGSFSKMFNSKKTK